VSTVVIVSHVGNVTVTGGSGPGVSVMQQVYYSKTLPTTTRTVSGTTLTVTYDCPGQLVCGVAYTLAVPRSAAVRVTAGAGSVRLTGLAGSLTAKADVGLINATGLTSASVSLTTRVGAISATFTAPPTAVRASANVGAITVHVPGTTSYKVAADSRVGKTTVSARQSASSGHAITATTDVGAIVVASSP
jgi:YD repeat-containing protein